jgi:medium-chain acyl-[acyl-carrier-protein] hydrolase
MASLARSPQPNTRTWARVPKRTQAQLRLFCFPYAGGRSQVFRDWIGATPKAIAVCPVQLPGENAHEDSITSVDEIVPMVAEGLLPYLVQPFAFFGHSMGAVIAFETLRFLRNAYKINATHLFVSGRVAPEVKDRSKPLHQLPQEDFVEELKHLQWHSSRNPGKC